jgi:hypothetical protein
MKTLMLAGLLMCLLLFGCVSTKTLSAPKEFDISYFQNCAPGQYMTMTRTGVDAIISIEDKGDSCRVILNYPSGVVIASGTLKEMTCLYSKNTSQKYKSYDAEPSTHLLESCSITRMD